MEVEKLKEQIKNIILEIRNKDKAELKEKSFRKKLAGIKINEDGSVDGEDKETQSLLNEMSKEIKNGNGQNAIVNIYRMVQINRCMKEVQFEKDSEDKFCWQKKEEKQQEKLRIYVRSSNNSENVPNEKYEKCNYLIIADNDKVQEGEDEFWLLVKPNESHVEINGLKSNEKKIDWSLKKQGKKIVYFTNSGLVNKIEELEGKSNAESDSQNEEITSKQKIFYGPPGTGKTRKAKIRAIRIIEGDKKLKESDALEKFKSGAYKEQIQLVQFHPNYSYNDFMETIDTVKKDYAKGVFKKFTQKAEDNKLKKYVLIIDEINRANVSEVLGELLYGLEYREETITTGISNESFSVPENLYIIGTMNTADRSLQALDYAVRRRFDFEKIKAKQPDPNKKDEEFYIIEGPGETGLCKYFLKGAFEKVQDDVKKSVARGINPEDIMPGASYFIVNGDENGYDKEHFEYKVRYELIPLLKEYAKNGIFIKRRKLDDGKSLIDYLYDKTDENAYLEKLKKLKKLKKHIE